MPSSFTELTRVQMPAMVHLTRIGYKYYGKIRESDADRVYDPDTNILLDEFYTKFAELNPGKENDASDVLRKIRIELDYDDLGKSFYNTLTSVSPYKLIDFDDPSNNSYYCTAEFTCKRDEEEFRPDITLFINGLPLVFIEVKKPNNTGGIVAEAERMNEIRFPKRKFRRFINITQLMIFSNNMEYDAEGGIVPIQGVFYCTGSRDKARFNCFREENRGGEKIAPYNADFQYKDIDYDVEKRILKDFNCQVIHSSAEYKENLKIDSPTNRVLTSMCSPERILFILKYAIAFFHLDTEENGKTITIDEKHIMRYQQMFAALAVRDQIKQGAKSGVIWHTQGSGKTALSYYLSNVLTDYFATVNKVPKYYFIVDRLDLLDQASREFRARGVKVYTASSRDELMQQFRDNSSMEGTSGEKEITVVNIQRFKEDREKIKLNAYSTNMQRVFIIAEAHRGYNPKGTFLANLFAADENSIKIALTGTPLLKEERESWKVFERYFHTYYYDKSIQDGYTLKIIREDIETSYREKLQDIYHNLETLVHKKDVPTSVIVEHDTYVKDLLRYIITDFTDYRIREGDRSLGGMIVCETGPQAKKMYALFDEVQQELIASGKIEKKTVPALILHDVDDKETREKKVVEFKENYTIDILIVFNMLLTGFDAKRLKRLYLGRKLKDHTLLQAITRVNRPYKEFRYGYIVDFADIKENFEQTNQAYLEELNKFNNIDEVGEGNTIDAYNQVLENKDAILDEMRNINQALFEYTLNNAEIFSQEISAINDKKRLLDLKKMLINARDYSNIVRTFGDEQLKEEFSKLNIYMVTSLLAEVQRHIDIINQKEAFETDDITRQIINEEMSKIKFSFNKIGTDELEIVSAAQLQDKWEYTIRAFTENGDQEDLEYITLKEAFMLRFKQHGFEIDSAAKFNEQAKALDDFISKLAELKRKNRALASKYNDDMKFARVHRRVKEENARRSLNHEQPIISNYDNEIVSALNAIKDDIDSKVYDRNDILRKDAYFEQTVMSEITNCLKELSIQGNREDRTFLRNKISRQYLNQYNETYSTHY